MPLSDVRSRSALFATEPGRFACAPVAGGTPAHPGRHCDVPLFAGGTPARPGSHRLRLAGGTPALPGRWLQAGRARAQEGIAMSRCLRAGRPRAQDGIPMSFWLRARRLRAQGRTVYVSRAGRPRSQDDGCGRDARAPRTASCQSGFSVSRSSIAVASAGSSACANSHPCPYVHDIERMRIN
jgi:hypothetical protein